MNKIKNLLLSLLLSITVFGGVTFAGLGNSGIDGQNTWCYDSIGDLVPCTGADVSVGTLKATGITLSGDLDMGGNDLLGVDSIFGSTSILPVRIGDAATTTRGLNSEDDLHVTGVLEVDGSTFFDGTTDFGGQLNTGSNSIFSNDNNGLQLRNTSQAPNAMTIDLGTTKAVLIIETADRTFDFAHAVETNPTLFIHSANQATDEWISFTHNQSNGILQVGVGSIQILSQVIFEASARFSDQQQMRFGSSNDAIIEYDTTQAPDGLLIGVGADNNSLIITEKADAAVNFAHAQQTDPTLFIQSADATDITQWISLSHNQTNAVLDSGKGDIQFNASPLVGAIEFAEDAGFVTAFDMSVSGNPTAGDEMSMSFKIDSNTVLKVYAEADSSGSIQNQATVTNGATVFTPSTDQTLAAGTTANADAGIIRVTGDSGAVTLTSTPSISAGLFDGQCVKVFGTDGTNTVTFQDEDNLANTTLALLGDVNIQLGLGDNFEVCWDSGDALWRETYRALTIDD